MAQQMGLVIIVGLLLTACGRGPAVALQAPESNTTAIGITMPDKTKLKHSDKLTHYYLAIEPTPATCDGSKIKKTERWSKTSLTESLKNGCDYKLVFIVGELDGNKLQGYLVNGSNGQTVSKAKLDGGSISIDVSLGISPLGERAGFGTATVQDPDQLTDATIKVQVPSTIYIDAATPSSKKLPSAQKVVDHMRNKGSGECKLGGNDEDDFKGSVDDVAKIAKSYENDANSCGKYNQFAAEMKASLEELEASNWPTTCRKEAMKLAFDEIKQLATEGCR